MRSECTNHSGGSQKTATQPALPSTSGTTRPISTRTEGNERSSLDPVKKSFSEQPKAMPFLFGEDSATTADREASTAQSSATKARTYRRSLSDRLTPLLISSGLVRGITPTSTRAQCGQPIQVLAFDMLAGGGVGGRKEGSLSSSDNPSASEVRS